jgi:hypothetical protein
LAAADDLLSKFCCHVRCHCVIIVVVVVGWCIRE